MKVKCILEQNNLKRLYELVRQSLPNYLYNFVSTTNFDVNAHNTRHRHNIRTVKIKHELKCLPFSIVNTIDNSPDITRKMYNVVTHYFIVFVSKLANMILARMILHAITYSQLVCMLKTLNVFFYFHSSHSHLKSLYILMLFIWQINAMLCYYM